MSSNKIAGPHTGIIKIRQVDVDEERGLIFATIKNNFENYNVNDPRPSPWDPMDSWWKCMTARMRRCRMVRNRCSPTSSIC